MSGRLPCLSHREVVRAFERTGFRVIPGRGKGSHIAMGRDDWGGILIVPAHDDVPRGTLRALIRQSGLSVDQFLELL